jgi:hypothetical protein
MNNTEKSDRIDFCALLDAVQSLETLFGNVMRTGDFTVQGIENRVGAEKIVIAVKAIDEIREILFPLQS